MNHEDRIKNWKLHNSQRGQFAFELYKKMVENENVWLLTGDLGWPMFDPIKEDFPERFVNTGAAEQALLDISCGLSLENKIPFVYSITPFLIYRPFETLRTYINYEKLNVKLIGGGRDDDYKHDGWSHDASDVKKILDTLPNITQCYPESNEEVTDLMDLITNEQKPYFVSLRR